MGLFAWIGNNWPLALVIGAFVIIGIVVAIWTTSSFEVGSLTLWKRSYPMNERDLEEFNKITNDDDIARRALKYRKETIDIAPFQSIKVSKVSGDGKGNYNITFELWNASIQERPTKKEETYLFVFGIERRDHRARPYIFGMKQL